MKQARLKLHYRIDAIDAFLDNTLIPALGCYALFAYLWSAFK